MSPPPADWLQKRDRVREALKKCRRLKAERDRDRYEAELGIRERREAWAAEQQQIEAELDAALERITAQAQAQRKAAREKADVALQSARERCERDVRARVQKAADPKAKDLLSAVMT